jgi:hypothetical protein
MPTLDERSCSRLARTLRQPVRGFVAGRQAISHQRCDSPASRLRAGLDLIPKLPSIGQSGHGWDTPWHGLGIGLFAHPPEALLAAQVRRHGLVGPLRSTALPLYLFAAILSRVPNVFVPPRPSASSRSRSAPKERCWWVPANSSDAAPLALSPMYRPTSRSST